MRARLKAKAWEHERPGKKPTVLGSEAGWRAELDDAGYTVDLPRVRRTAPIALDELHIEEIASRALDRCAAGASAWTVHTLCEHVTRITTEHGVQAAPSELREFVRLATQLAAEDCFSVLPPDAPTPEHVAHLTSLRVVAAEAELHDLLTARAERSIEPAPDVQQLAARVGLDDDQERAASAVASVNPLVVIEGAAGSGKTTMLKTAIAATASEGRSTRVVTPTKKAADVAAQELGIPTDSVAALVYAHGFRWNSDGVWMRLRPGDTDPETGGTYRGPAVEARLVKGERMVVDEAGMLDQDSALALLRIADEAGATIALVGDRAQLPAVGRGGVLDVAARLTPVVVDMTSLHRFTDDAYAALTLELRHGRNPAMIFDQINALGLIKLHEGDDDMQETIAKTACLEDAITAATNDDARMLNERIRAERVDRGEVDDARTMFGSDGLPIGKGDVIQTRRNECTLGVANRQTWTVQHVGDDGALSVVETLNGRKQQRTVTLPAEYATEDTHLAYAVTGYGVQGATVNASHTVLSDALDAAGVYVGMTRGRETNILHVVATDLDDAKQQFVNALARDRADRGLEDAAERARGAVADLVVDGPVSIVSAERDRIAKRIAKAEAEREHWVSAAATLRDQSERHKAEYEPQRELAAAADARVAALLANVVESLAQEATTDGAEFLAAQQAAYTAHRTEANAPHFRKHSATRAAKDADARREDAERVMHARWQSIPHSESSLAAWAEAAGQRQADHAPEIIEARAEATKVRQIAKEIAARQSREHTALYERVLGNRRPSAVAARVNALREHAAQDRLYLAQLDAPPDEAVQLVREHAAQNMAQRLAGETARRAEEKHEGRFAWTRHRDSDPHRPPPRLGL